MKLTQDDVRQLVKDFLDRTGQWFPPVNSQDPAVVDAAKDSLIVMVDDNYSPIDQDILNGLLASDPNLVVPASGTVTEIDDCDDFANYLKAMMVARTRAGAQLSGDTPYPPAIGVLISQNHAINIFVGLTGGDNPFVGVIDASNANRHIIKPADEARRAMKTFPLQLVYI